MARYQYQIFIPGGNKTALVLGVDGLENDTILRKTIQDKILVKHEHDTDGEVEQVGFVSVDKTAPQLIMTGGEFCGNATRSAAAYYLLESRNGEIEIKVSGTQKPVKAGLSVNGTELEAWAEMPLIEDLSQAIIPLDNGLYWVSIEGISHLIVPQEQSAPYLSKILSCEKKNEQINIAIQLLKQTIEENSFSPGKACGIMFLENKEALKMHPFVHVVSADTTYYETACGSGAMCVGLVKSFLNGENINLPLLQPSGKIIRAEVEYSETGKAKMGRISGEIIIGETGELEC
jgi:diaminopimelate epimerase